MFRSEMEFLTKNDVRNVSVFTYKLTKGKKTTKAAPVLVIDKNTQLKKHLDK